MFKRFLIFTALSGFFCVAFGAFASHALSKQLSAEAINWIEIGWRYQVFHTLALFGLTLLSQFTTIDISWRKKTAVSGYCWLVGILLFSFSLYCLALTGNKTFAHITPIGGVFFLLGWGYLAYLGVRYRHSSNLNK